MNEVKIPIYLTDDEAKCFVSFQKHRGLIKLLEDVGFFTLKNGRVEININEFGQVGDIYVHKRYNELTKLRI